MLAWFQSRCPVDTWDQAWTEWRFRWLVSRIGFDRIAAVSMVLPEDEWFAELVAELGNDLAAVLPRLGGTLGIAAADVRLEVCDDEQLPGALAHYDAGPPPVIRVAKSHLASGAVLAVTLAHELAHHLLIGGKLLTESPADEEFVTDLTCAMLGMGVVQANTVIVESYLSAGHYHEWQMKRRGYLPAHVLGYALAVWSYACGKEHVDLSAWLRRDAAETYRRGLKYLRRGGECLVEPGTIRSVSHPRLSHETRADLRHRSAHRRLCALWEILTWPATETAALRGEIESLARDRDAEVRRASLDVLATLEQPVEEFERTIVAALDDRSPTVRCAAAALAGRWKLRADLALAPLVSMLHAIDREEVVAAARALVAFGSAAHDALKSLFEVLHGAIASCDYELVDDAVAAIRAIADNPFAAATAIYRDDGSEKLAIAREALRAGSRSAS